MSKVTNPTGEPSVSCGFFNSRNDRRYDALQMSSLFDGIINDGIFASIGDCFIVKATDTNVVTVGTGRAWFNHTWTTNDTILSIDCGVSEVLQDRIDAIVIEVNSQDDVRDNFIKLVKGVPSDSPTNPTLINADGVNQHVLCYIRRIAGSTKITQAEITNMVGSNETPYVTGPLEVISHEKLLGQWQSQLDQFVAGEKQEISTWFEGIKSMIGSDSAVNLQLQVNNLKTSVTNIEKLAGKCPHVELTGGSLLEYVKNLNAGVHTSFQFSGATDTPYPDWYYAEVFTHCYNGPDNTYALVYLYPLNNFVAPTYKGVLMPNNFSGWLPDVTQAQIDDLKSSVVNGKTSIANAINDKLGTTLSGQNTHDELANHINQLSGSADIDFNYYDSDFLSSSSYGTISATGRVFCIDIGGNVSESVKIATTKLLYYWYRDSSSTTPSQLLPGNLINSYEGKYILMSNEITKVTINKTKNNKAVVSIDAVAR